MATVDDEIRSGSKALEKSLAPVEQMLDGFKRKIAEVLRDFVGETREGRFEINRIQREIDLRKKAVALTDAKARKKLGELLQRFGRDEMILKEARARFANKAGKLAGRKDQIMKVTKELLKRARNELVVDQDKMNGLLTELEQIITELKAAHQGMRLNIRSEDEMIKEIQEAEAIYSERYQLEKKSEELTLRLKAAKIRSEQDANELAKKERERKKLEETLQRNENITEQLISSLSMCDESISGFKAMFGKKNLAITCQRLALQKKGDVIRDLSESLKKVEDSVKMAFWKVSEQLDKKAAEVREFGQVLDAKGEEVKKCIAEDEEEEKKPLSAEKGEHTRSNQDTAERMLDKYTGNPAYAKVKDAYMKLASNSAADSGTLYSRANILIYYRSLVYPCDLDEICISGCSVDNKGATIIACGLKLSTKVTKLWLSKQALAQL
ncbi:MAG: hypothetical protein P4L69_14900 [Desulfosporosinus sp.]|nr:hypothetical protein [Desulfosporosinus sp.]